MFLSDLLEAADHIENRAEFIRKTLGPKWNGLPGFEKLDDFIKKLAKIDPTSKGIYMPWLARLCINKPEINRVEDLDRLAKDLKIFEEKKSQIANKDINSYKSFADVYTAIEPFLTKKKTPEEKRAARLEKLKSSSIIDVYNGPEGWIKIPITKQAAQFLGQNTRWCTAGKNSNMFDSYNNEDRLFVVYDKATKARFQLHMQTGQFADVTDKMVAGGLKSVPNWAKDPIIDWYKEHNPQLTLKQLLGLSSMKQDTSLASGTEHEEVMDLMKKYGVL